MGKHPLNRRINRFGKGRLQRSSFVANAKAFTQKSAAAEQTHRQPILQYQQNPPWKLNQEPILVESIPGIEKKNRTATRGPKNIEP